MKLKFEFIDEDTDQKIVIKNKGNKVFYHDSDVHDTGEYEELTGKIMKFDAIEKEMVNTFYKLADNILSKQ